jgi:hypothetical protein
MKEEVRMALDEPGRERGPWKVDHVRACGSGDVRSDGGNPVAFDQDRPAGVRLRVHSVEDLRGTQEDRICSRWTGKEQRQHGCGEVAELC